MRIASVFIRSTHMVSAAMYLGYGLLSPIDPARYFPLVVAGMSGLFLVGTEWRGHPDLWRQASGWIIGIKLALFALVPYAPAPLLLTCFFVAGVGSHLPKYWRGWRLF